MQSKTFDWLSLAAYQNSVTISKGDISSDVLRMHLKFYLRSMPLVYSSANARTGVQVPVIASTRPD